MKKKRFYIRHVVTLKKKLNTYELFEMLRQFDHLNQT